jgi:hypothetical protein
MFNTHQKKTNNQKFPKQEGLPKRELSAFLASFGLNTGLKVARAAHVTYGPKGITKPVKLSIYIYIFITKNISHLTMVAP